MLTKLKSVLYFPLANYFRFFAAIRLKRWNPRVVVVTGSNGKTTLLHLLESQIGEKAKFSHHANSSYGIPFDILDLHRNTLRSSEWISLFVKAPFRVLLPVPQEKIYVVEADCDRPKEGEFLASLLNPEVVLWTSISGTHGMNFDDLVSEGKFTTVHEAIAYEYGYFLEYCQKLAIIDGDSLLQMHQSERAKTKVITIKASESLESYKIDKKSTKYKINTETYTFPALLPEEIFYSIAMCRATVEYLDLNFDSTFKHFIIPPGRSSVFDGIKDTILIDSTYNANLASIQAILSMFAKMPVKKKWVVLGDMLELGESEKSEHEELARTLAELDLTKIILIGKKNKDYTYPTLVELLKPNTSVVVFETAKEALVDIQKNMTGGEAILLKGSQSLFLEGVIQPLLANQKDADFLPRREAFWEEKRATRGL